MTIRLVDEGWRRELAEAAHADASELRIICPFIKVGALESLLSRQPVNVQVITRFNLADFAEGVSDIAVLRRLLDINARVRGVRNLHAKLYLFGASRAVITSANLTDAALSRNHELGVVAEDPETIAACRTYFDTLWQHAGNDLRPDQVDAWDKTVTGHRLRGGRPNETASLGDFGADVGIAEPPPVQMPTIVADASQAFVKFLGTSADRISLSRPIVEEIAGSGCHWAVAYPATRQPRGVRNDAVIFIARLTQDPTDIRIFGRAIGMKYTDERDDATPDDIARRPWKEKWSRYIRVHHAEFVAGAMENGISLNELMATLSADSFASTQRHAASGEGNTNPRRAYLRRAAVQLSGDGLSWLSEQLQAAFEAHGKVPQDTLNRLDWPDGASWSSIG